MRAEEIVVGGVYEGPIFKRPRRRTVTRIEDGVVWALTTHKNGSVGSLIVRVVDDFARWAVRRVSLEESNVS